MPLGFAAEVGSSTYGVVSAIKLFRSVMIKGVEALAIESLLAARHYGVEDEVLASLAETFPGLEIAGLRADGVFADAAPEASWRELADCVLRPARDARPGAAADSKLA